MSVYKPGGSSIYLYDFQHQGCRFHGSTGCKTKRDAERVEAEKRREAALGETPKQAITLDQACGAWWQGRGVKLKGGDTLTYQLQNLITHLGARTELKRISLVHLDAYVRARRAHVSDVSVNRELELLRRVINWLDERGYSVPRINFKQVIAKEGPGRTRILSAEEERRLIAALPHGLLDLISYALMSAQRRAEVVTLRWSEVSLEDMRVVRLIKGGDTHSYPLTAQMVALIKRQPKVGPFVFTYVCERSAPKRKDRPQRVRGERYPYSVKGWNRKWKRACKAAGLIDFRFHDLRHTGLTRLGSIEAANRLAGHKDMKTTQRYFHTHEAAVREAMRASESRTIPEAGRSKWKIIQGKQANDG